MNSSTPTTDAPQFGRFSPAEHQEISDVLRSFERAQEARIVALAELRSAIGALDRVRYIDRCAQIDAIRSSTTHTPRPALAALQQRHDEALDRYTDAERAYRNMSDILDESIADCVARTQPTRSAQERPSA